MKGLTKKRRILAWSWSFLWGFIIAPLLSVNFLMILLWLLLIFVGNIIPYAIYAILDFREENKSLKSKKTTLKKDTDYIRDMFFNNIEEFKKDIEDIENQTKSSENY